MIPILNINAYTGVLFFVILIIVRALSNIITPPKSNWVFSLVDDRHRGSFQATINIVSLAGGIAFTYAVSYIYDMFESQNDTRGAFTLLTVMIFVLSLLDLPSILPTKEKKVEINKFESPFSDVKVLFKNKRSKRL